MILNATVVTIKQNHDTRSYGQLANLLTELSEISALVKVGIPADVPEDAIVTKADLVYHTRLAMTGSRLFTMREHTSAGFKVSSATWKNAPAYGGAVYSETVGAVAAGTEFRIDLIASVQGFVSGASVNYGWRFYTDDTTQRSLYGPTAAQFQPYLDLEYVVPGDPPGGLSPAGVVSIAKPTVTFVTADDMTALQVQIDPAQDEVSPDFDSGTVASTAGLLDLTRTDMPGGVYAGLSAGSTTSWRARTFGSSGWTDWSEWAEFSRVAKVTVTITSPSSTSGDVTPPVVWTAPGQVTWQAFYYNAVTGNLLDQSDPTTSADLDWTPTNGLRTVGAQGRFEVRVWDDEDRVATPGDPVYASDTQTFTIVASDAADGVDDLIVVGDWYGPGNRLAWSGDASDEKQIVRDDVWLDRIDGTLVEYEDITAAPRREYTYQVLLVSDGDVSPNGPVATGISRPIGAWLVNPDTGERILIVNELVEVDMTEQAVLHAVIGDGPPIRRRAGIPPPSGTASGTMMDGYLNGEDVVAADMEAIALGFKVADQGQVYRLVWADKNYPVFIGNMNPRAYMEGDHHVAYATSFLWWHTGAEDWT